MNPFLCFKQVLLLNLLKEAPEISDGEGGVGITQPGEHGVGITQPGKGGVSTTQLHKGGGSITQPG